MKKELNRLIEPEPPDNSIKPAKTPAAIRSKTSLYAHQPGQFDGEVVVDRPNIVRGLELMPEELWRDFEHKVRKNVNCARRSGLTAEIDLDGRRLEEFLAIYYATMERRGADGGYYFPREFFEAIDNDRIVAAIAAAEGRSRGEIRVHVASDPVEDAFAAARADFERLGMTRTRERNGVLILLAPESQRFAILGDAGLDHVCQEGFWDEVVESMRGAFREGRFTEGIVAAARETSIGVPLVVRLEGTEVEQGREILKSSGLDIVTATDMTDAARKVVEAAGAVGGQS